MFGSGQKFTSEQWFAVAELLFGDLVTVNGQEFYVRDKEKMFRFRCMHCNQNFESFTTPTICPHCKREPDERGVTLTHKSHSALTFPFDSRKETA